MLRRLPGVLVCLLLFVIYNSNPHFLTSADTLPARLLPFSLLLNGNLYLDEWMQPFLQHQLDHGIYFATKSHGHWMSSYPILLPFLVLPLYMVPVWWLSHQPKPVDLGMVFLIADTMEKLSAALIAALSVWVLYRALRKVVSPVAGMLIALIYGLASSTWSISSQALWTHGLTQLAFALLLWSLLRSPAAPGYAFWVGLALAIAVANRPPTALLLLVVLVYFVRHQRNRLVPLFAPLLIFGCLVLAYNLYFFGNLFGAYSPAHRMMGYRGVLDAFSGSLGSGAAGLLMSLPWTG